LRINAKVLVERIGGLKIMVDTCNITIHSFSLKRTLSRL
jgi:hypothetical protein